MGNGLTRQTFIWALFDFANTFFAIAMLSFYFPLWIVEDRGVKELAFSITLAVSMGIVALLMPLCGALSDATGERMRFLRWTTYGCTLSTVLVSLTPHVPLALALFGLANICYQLGTMYYDALLWTIASPGQLGRTSGFGASFGYLGSMAGLLLLWPFVSLGGHQAAFAPSALFFLLFALPSFLMIREHRATGPIAWKEVGRTAWRRTTESLRSARAVNGLWSYFWASFFSLNAINTVLVFMGVYTRKVLGLSESEMIRFFVFSQLFAIAGSLALGWLVGRWGAKRTLGWIWCGWMGALALVAMSPAVQWLWVAGPVIGFCLGSTWATSRALVVELSPKHQLAQMLGLAGVFARASSILGPLLWGILVLEPAQSQHAVLALVGLLAIGLWCLRRVPNVVA